MVGHGYGHDEPTRWVHHDLGIVMLVETGSGAVFQEARVRIGKVVLILVAWPRLRRCGGGPAWWTFILAGFFFPLAYLGLLRRFFSGLPFVGAGFQHRFGLGQVDQAFLPKGHFLFHTETWWQREFALVGWFAQRQ